MYLFSHTFYTYLVNSLLIELSKAARGLSINQLKAPPRLAVLPKKKKKKTTSPDPSEV